MWVMMVEQEAGDREDLEAREGVAGEGWEVLGRDWVVEAMETAMGEMEEEEKGLDWEVMDCRDLGLRYRKHTWLDALIAAC